MTWKPKQDDPFTMMIKTVGFILFKGGKGDPLKLPEGLLQRKTFAIK